MQKASKQQHKHKSVDGFLLPSQPPVFLACVYLALQRPRMSTGCDQFNQRVIIPSQFSFIWGLERENDPVIHSKICPILCSKDTLFKNMPALPVALQTFRLVLQRLRKVPEWRLRVDKQENVHTFCFTT